MDKIQADNATTAAGITRMALPLQQKAMDLAGTAGNIWSAFVIDWCSWFCRQQVDEE